ncbi:YifB family Mg chelatase-like AAA ATPase [Subtercola boreus]|uniref:Mg chelatase-like protein n=1 Tax=Subtercola boreus TaxID=120213 RepID=A0A3E0WDV1_9MICO|nr:YifB family Mg chelatase-like AAA ATPase [Subtercola boreus]RFA22030.1 Mg chelatase-like protein [Subtercola boreus]RFA22210.1 Mg chelatase-like protein [Subtercola boreus]RFA28072.1 Mg chelatase-like protein [Subtercola boreus]
MMVSRTHSVALLGMTGSMVEVEADIGNGLPTLMIIGLPDTALSDARDRVRAAAANSGCPLPTSKITVNLSPAALPKHGSTFDLSIAMAILAAAGTISAESIENVVHLGELSLDGRLRPMNGVLPAIAAAAAEGFRTFVVPAGNRHEAELVPGVRIVPVISVRDAAIHHGASFEPIPLDVIEGTEARDSSEPHHELADVIGNDDAVLALVAAAAGGHHIFMLGPPGAGKTMLAMRLPGLLPDLETSAALEVSSVRSLSGASVPRSLAVRPPFESPHHTASAAALVGGGSKQIRPGAAARASHGVLFLDEAPEFATSALDALRQPLESGVISIHRANAIARFPGRFQLVLAANPCPCGQYGTAELNCLCTPNTRRRYLARLSGPLLDRIDIQVQVRRVTAAQLRMGAGETRLTTTAAREHVVEARGRMARRLAATPWRLNSEVLGTWLRTGPERLPRGATDALDRALERGLITMRGYDRILRVAWTLSDLDGVDRPTADQIGRALYLRKSLST